MERYLGQDLRERPHIAVFIWDKIGNFVVATVVLRALRERFPECVIDVLSGDRTRELEDASDLIDTRFSIVGAPDALPRFAGFVEERTRKHGRYDLAINLDAERLFQVAITLLDPMYVVGAAFATGFRDRVPGPGGRLDDLASDARWNRADLLQDFGDLLTSQYLGEIWCRMAFLETDFTQPVVPVADPGGDVPDVLIVTGGTRKAKLWPTAFWEDLAHLVRDAGRTVGLVGIARSQQSAHYGAADPDDSLVEQFGVIDLRGRWTLPQVAGAAQRARATVSIDNGIGHIASAVGAPTIMLWGGSPWRLWRPRSANVRHIMPADVCMLCEISRFQQSECLRERHACMESITPQRVMREIRRLDHDRSAV